MSEHYKTDLLDLRRMDCMDLMAQYPNNHFDLAIVDPPYGLGNKCLCGSGKLKNRTLNISDVSWDSIPDDAYFYELKRISHNQIIWGGNYFKLPPTRGIICWDKMQPWENFSQWEMAWTSFDTPAKIYKFDNRTGNKIHPTQKPVALYRWILANYAKPGDKILDTHLGSGSNAIACHYAGYHLTASEIDQDYFDESIERINRETAQMTLQFGT